MLYIIVIMNTMDCTSSTISMEYYENRLKTFDIYPKQMLPDKYQLARAGFTYTGKGDLCECFSCHVRLSAWDRDDDAMKEHYKWSKNCDYIKMVGAPQVTTGFICPSNTPTYGSNSFTGGNLFVRTPDPKQSQNWRNNCVDA